MRTGPELVRATNPFAKEDRATTWRLLLITLATYGLSAGAAAFLPWWPLRLLASVLTGLIVVRIFIFYHDYLHGAIFTDSKLGGLIMKVFGWWVLAGPSVWRQTHDYHHKNTAKMVGASIGSYPVITVEIWQNLSTKDKFRYAVARHPLTIVLGYVTVFVWGMCIAPFKRQPKQHIDGLISLVVHFSCVALVGLTLGWDTALFAVVLPEFFATAAGSYLFYAQHNFPGMELRPRAEWEYSFAALRSSSMFDMPPVMHWFTGNIGYHHVHHLNHRIPFYRLPEAMAALPELRNPVRTSWRPADVLACLRGKVWDPNEHRMVSFADADRAAPPSNALPAK